MKIQLALMLSAALCACSTAQNVYCGRRLAMALAMLCEQPADKRAGGPFLDYWLPSRHAHSRTDGDSDSWLPHAHSHSDISTGTWPPQEHAHSTNELDSWEPRAHSQANVESAPWSHHAHGRSENEAVPWVSASRARAIGRGKRQVVMECCMKPCSEDELLSYC